MIKFFRKIRQDLLTKNNFSKYLLYALGEIVLVVIGILIALQLNNYNDSLKQDKLEQKTLHNLKLDFEFNLSEMEGTINTLEVIRNASLTIINKTGVNFSDDFDIDTHLDLLPATPQYFPKNGFLLELINSGKLSIISNDKLRNRLSSWLPTLETLQDREHISAEYDITTIGYITKNGSWLKIDAKSRSKQIKNINFPKSGFDADNKQLLKSIEFENIIENQIFNKTVLLERQEKCFELNQEIIDLLELEIKK